MGEIMDCTKKENTVVSTGQQCFEKSYDVWV